MASQNQEGTRTEASLQTRWSLIGRLKDMDDQQSWQEFFDAYWKLIYSVALKAGLSDAEAQEVVQETVISVAKKMPEFKADPAAGSFKSWLLTLTRWRIVDQAQIIRSALFLPATQEQGEGVALVAALPPCVYSWFRFAAQIPAMAPDRCPSQEIGPAWGSSP